MKTIQHYLKECDREAIANHYIYNYLFDSRLMDPKYNEITICDLKERMKNKIFRLITDWLKWSRKLMTTKVY